MGRVALALTLFLSLLTWSPSARAGYTHYWTWKKQPDPAALDATLLEMEKVVETRRAVLQDGEQRGGVAARFRDTCPWGRKVANAKEHHPSHDGGLVTADGPKETPCILFNGLAPLDYETFGFPLAPFPDDPDFSFVKTAKRPYDEVVVACLLVAHDHFPNDVLEIKTDGVWPGDFREGAKLYEDVTKRSAEDPFTNVTETEYAPPREPPITRTQMYVRWGIFGAIGLVLLVVLGSRRR